MFCALLTSRYQVSVYRTNGPLVFGDVTGNTHICFWPKLVILYTLMVNCTLF